jgi:hypothetical protein
MDRLDQLARIMWWPDYRVPLYRGGCFKQPFCCSCWILLNVVGLIIPAEIAASNIVAIARLLYWLNHWNMHDN